MQHSINKETKKVILEFNFEEITDNLTIDFAPIIKEIKGIPDKRNLFIEWINGKESHSSYWGKFYVKGIEGVAEDHKDNRKDNHHSYQFFVKNIDENDKDLFSVFVQGGSKRGTEIFEFHICQVDALSHNKIKGTYYYSPYIEGNFKILASGVGKTKAPRLMGWWIDNVEKQSVEYAQKCAVAINKRGVKTVD